MADRSCKVINLLWKPNVTDGYAFLFGTESFICWKYANGGSGEVEARSSAERLGSIPTDSRSSMSIPTESQQKNIETCSVKLPQNHKLIECRSHDYESA